jgi:hypothetical protein
MRPAVPAVAAFAGALSLAACGYQQSVLHPRMPLPSLAESEVSCPQLDRAIDRADTVRWVIRDDGGELESEDEKAGRYTANVLIVAVTLAAGMPDYLRDGGHGVLDAVDVRLIALLLIKRERECRARPTAIPGLDDYAMANELQALQSRIEGEEGRAKPLLDERTRLLDGLRVMPPPAASPTP